LDAYAAVGYAHGIRNAWTALILRQAALGRLGEWFGSEGVEIDIAARMLALSPQAQVGYGEIDPAARQVLSAYASGLSAALGNESVLRDELLVLLRIDEIEPWLPWHSIAVERLVSWLATSVEYDPAVVRSELPIDFVRLMNASSKLREWLALEGFSNSAAWAVRRDDVTHLFYRLVLGSSIKPYVQETSIHTGEPGLVNAVFLVGTPFMFAGQNASKSWAILPHQTAVVRPSTSDDRTTARSRITFADGSEQLIAYQLTDGGLSFGRDSSGVDLMWPGLKYSTDSEAWISVASDLQTSFSVFDGTSIEVTRAGVWTVNGPDRAVRKINGGVYVGHSDWSRFPAQRLANWMDEGYAINITALKNDTYSEWAESVVPELLTVAGSRTGDTEYDEAIQYLRNWDYSYSASSIAGAIFDSWATQVWLTTGLMPGLDSTSGLDSLGTVPALRSALDRLRRAYGSDQSAWRWERVQMNQRNWPLWQMIERRSNSMARSRFAPVTTIGSGHPSSLAWGATSNVARGRPPGKWESWITTEDWSWSYTSDTNLDNFSRFRRTDAPLSTALTVTLPDASLVDGRNSTMLVPAS
ncbi:MAG: hypothetical protein HKN13_08395, partial [Rhodothermales bacterium]|nr:hypothetical protein [Rhodothermales bacterium]